MPASTSVTPPALALVTGGAGFIGSHIVHGLLERGYRVRVLDNLSTGKAENLASVRDRVELIEGSVSDLDTAARAVEGCAAVFHEAANPSVVSSVDFPLRTNEDNVKGTLVMLDAARKAGVGRFVYAASSSAYGNNLALPTPEKAELSPTSPYAASKLSGELYCQCYAGLYPMEIVRLRYFNVYGPRQNPGSQYACVIPNFVSAALRREPLRLDGDGLQSRDFVYVGDVVQANLRSLTATGVSGEVFNVGSGERHSLQQLIRLIGEIAGYELLVNQVPARHGDVSHTLAGISKARQLLGYQPSVTFEEGLRLTFEAFAAGSDRP